MRIAGEGSSNEPNSITVYTDSSISNIGRDYWLPKEFYSQSLWVVYADGHFNYESSGQLGVRVMVTLKSGVTTNGGNGSAESPFTLTGITY